MLSSGSPRLCEVCSHLLPKRNKRFCSLACYAEFQRQIPGPEVLQNLYWDKGMSCGDIAKQFNVVESRISVLFKRHKIPLRNISEATKLGFSKHGGPKRGEESHNWKGGKRIGTRGYVLIWKPNHPRADKGGYIAEHVLAWEEAHGKPVPRGWIIHHLNGIKTDNRPENLVALPSQKHYDVLRAKAERIRSLEIEVKKLKDALEKNQSIFYVS